MSNVNYQDKADWYGRTIVKVSRWFPSTQICSNCDYVGRMKFNSSQMVRNPLILENGLALVVTLSMTVTLMQVRIRWSRA